jgi:hypothetical protein
MPRPTTAKAGRHAPAFLAEAEEIGRELVRTLGRVIDAPGTRPSRPSGLAVSLDFNRVLISRIVNSLKCEDPLEALQRLPGPESLRGFAAGMGRIGVAASRVKEALAAIDRFETLIRDRYGTRGKLNAAICSHAPSMQRRLELENRQRVFAGMRELRGFEAETWLSTSIVFPHREDPSKLNVLLLQGFIGLRQLRSDLPIYFDFMLVGTRGAEPQAVADIPTASVGLEDLYTNPPADTEILEVDGRKVYRLAQEQVGKDVVCDMLSFVCVPGFMPRYANPEGRRMGPFALIKAPVKTLHFDILLAEGLVDGSDPELFVFSPGPQTGANVNDRVNSLDRVSVPERVEVVPPGPGRFEVPAVPNYRQMLDRIARAAGQDLDAMRVHRLSVAHPPFGFEFVSTFRLRAAAR